MYTDTDRKEAQSAARRACVVAGLFLAAGVLCLIAGLIARVKALALLGLGLGGCAAYFVFSMKARPRLQYARFLREAENGRSREARVFFEALSDTPRVTEEGVCVRELTARDETGEPRLFYFDDAKQKPTFKPGQRVRLTAYGRYVINLEAE